MKKIFLILAVLLASCGTTHKSTHTDNEKSDVKSTIVKDSTGINKQLDYNDNFTLKGLDIQFDYGNNDSLFDTSEAIKHVKSQVSNLINQAVSSNGLNGKIPASVKIHIDSITASSSTILKVDSIHVKDTISKDSVVNIQKNNEEITKTGLPVSIKVILILVVILGIGFFVVKKFL